MLSFLSDALRRNRRSETSQEKAKRRYLANKEALCRDKEFYQRWANPSNTRW